MPTLLPRTPLVRTDKSPFNPSTYSGPPTVWNFLFKISRASKGLGLKKKTFCGLIHIMPHLSSGWKLALKTRVFFLVHHFLWHHVTYFGTPTPHYLPDHSHFTCVCQMFFPDPINPTQLDQLAPQDVGAWRPDQQGWLGIGDQTIGHRFIVEK